MSRVARVIALMPSIMAGLLRHRQCRRRGVAPSGSTHYTNAPTNEPATVLHSICPLTEFPGVRVVRCCLADVVAWAPLPIAAVFDAHSIIDAPASSTRPVYPAWLAGSR